MGSSRRMVADPLQSGPAGPRREARLAPPTTLRPPHHQPFINHWITRRTIANHDGNVVTTLTISPKIRDRLKRYGHAGMTYDEILQAMMDKLDEQAFVQEMRRRAAELDEADGWVDLDDVPE